MTADRSRPRVHVIGGGLAGMTVAYTLARHGFAVTIYEASHRLGGKAGAEYDAELDVFLDHGFHIFPLWYVNTRRLLSELGIVDRLIDTDTQHTITRADGNGGGGRWYTNYAVTSVRRFLHNISNSPLRWDQSLVGTYFLVDLASASFEYRGFLDRVSVTGYFRSRFYRHEAIANFNHFLGLQASSIPGDAMSAMTYQRVVKGFMQYRSQLVSMLCGDLQTQFIAPFEARLEQLNVQIVKNTPVQELSLGGDRLASLRLAAAAPTAAAPASADDVYVLATPPEVTRRFISDRIYALEANGYGGQRLSDLHRLTSAPMAAMHVAFKRRLPHIPPWHTGLYGSRYGLSFIDISQHWPVLKDRDQTLLSIIAANFDELSAVCNAEQQTRYLVDDLLSYLRYDAAGQRIIEDADIAAVRVTPHLDAPLFLNTTNAWDYRPDGRTCLKNVFVAGDYCRSPADLTTMESAIGAARQTAALVLNESGIQSHAAGAEQFDVPSPWLLRAAKWGCLPVILPIGAAYAISRRGRPDEE